MEKSLVSALTKRAGRMGLLLKKHSPEILIGVGIVSAVGSTILACKATLKVEEIVDDAHEKLEKINHVVKNPEKYEGKDYSPEDATKDKVIVYTQTCAKMLKLYAPALSLGVLSITCLLGAHNIMSKRNIAVMAAYKAVEQSFLDYRRKVVDEFGADKDAEYRYGIIKEDITETEVDEETGKKKRVKSTVEKTDPNHYSQYARFFDESSVNWSKTPEYNLIFLRAQQNYANDLLRARGHLFLNEVYDMLGIQRSQAGAVVGWVLSEDGDNFVDFGIYELNNARARDFVNGYERSILLDFNVDGVIYDLI